MLRRSLPSHVLLVLLALVAASCGGDDAPTATTSPAATTTPAPRADDSGDDGSDAVVTPTRAALAADGRLVALVTAYAPVSARVNYLVAAETLRADAVDTKSGKAVIDERTGTVGFEIRRMRVLLRRVRPRIVAAQVANADEQHVQQLMLEAIDARTRALGFLERELAASANEDVGDSVVKAYDDQWDAAWDKSLRRAREATTAMQDLRAQLGLAPAPEESIR